MSDFTGAEHDRTRDRDVIEAAYLLKKLAGQRGLTLAALADEILAREEQYGRDATNMHRGNFAYRQEPWPLQQAPGNTPEKDGS